MKIVLLLVLAAILWNIRSNAVRVRRGFSRFAEAERRSAEVDAIMAQVGEKRARLKELSVEFQRRHAACSGAKSSWQSVDNRLVEMKDCLLALNFAGALAAVSGAVTEAERLVSEAVQPQS
ncbi:MAG: hypothetical protein IPM23_01160 [Candidatus Melainabacteria bacterium]|nr:hypothetical protein [Candidatus Melainabacteria bacterium]